MIKLIFALGALSPFMAHVYEYNPAPGQFVNEAPEYEDGDTYDDMLSKAEEQLCGEATPGLVTLGAFGGYIIFGFDHPVANVEGQADFKIYGNAITNGSEPGIVSVSIDSNGNGLPDDPWYELRGSEYDNPETISNFSIEYFRPLADHTDVPDPEHSFVTDAEYSRWVASDSTEGYIYKTTAHDQPYWPLWLDASLTTLNFKGTRLPDNGVDRNGKGTNYNITPFEWGYVDNIPNTRLTGFDLGNAVDADGKPVNLSHADFFRVHTAVRQNLGWLGESSTEIAGAEDLHPDISPDDTGMNTVQSSSPSWRLISTTFNGVDVEVSESVILTIHRPDGTVITTKNLTPGRHHISVPETGILILHGNCRSLKIMR